MFTRMVLIAIALSLAGCAASNDPKVLPSNHPANQSAAEAPITEPVSVLALVEPPATAASDDSMGSLHGMHPTSFPATTQNSAVYTCPMHPDVVSAKPGKCPKCGMTLVLKKGEAR